MKNLALVGILAVAGVAAAANAAEFRVRFVERIGNADTVIDGNNLDVTNLEARRIRVQFGVFDDAAGAAPAGGFVGWNIGTIAVSAEGNSVNTRTNGRVAPFVFATGVNSNGNPPLPGGDPFTSLTDIDATLGTQSPAWNCDANGNPLPQPAALVRGRNTFVSVYEITTNPGDGAATYTITLGGNLIAAAEWREVGTPIPPDCGDPSDPADDVPGSITYAPFPTDPVGFNATLTLTVIPAPGAAALLGLGGLVAIRRRR